MDVSLLVALSGIAGALITKLVDWLLGRKGAKELSARQDFVAITTQYKEMVKRIDEDAESLRRECRDLRIEVKRLTDEHLACKDELQEVKAQISDLKTIFNSPKLKD